MFLTSARAPVNPARRAPRAKEKSDSGGFPEAGGGGGRLLIRPVSWFQLTLWIRVAKKRALLNQSKALPFGPVSDLLGSCRSCGFLPQFPRLPLQSLTNPHPDGGQPPPRLPDDLQEVLDGPRLPMVHARIRKHFYHGFLAEGKPVVDIKSSAHRRSQEVAVTHATLGHP